MRVMVLIKATADTETPGLPQRVDQPSPSYTATFALSSMR